MSVVNFEKHPPSAGTKTGKGRGKKTVSEGDAIASKEYKPGSVVEIIGWQLFGELKSCPEVGKVEVLIPNFEQGVFQSEVFPHDQIIISSPEVYFNFLCELAERQGKTKGDLWTLHMPLANGRDKNSYVVLAELHMKLKSLQSDKQNADYEGIWNTIEETAGTEPDIFAQFEDAEAPKPVSAQESVPVSATQDQEPNAERSAITAELNQSIAAGVEAVEPVAEIAATEESKFVPKPLTVSPLAQAPGDNVPKLTKDELKMSHVLYECEHNLKRYTYWSDGICYVDWADSGEQASENLLFLDQASEHSPIAQAIMHASRIRLGLIEGFKVDTWRKLDWYHSKVINLENEIETVKETLNQYLSMLKNDQKSLERLKDDALEFAQTLLKGDDKQLQMTHGTINFIDYKETCVLDESAEGAEARKAHLKALFKNKETREQYKISVQVVTTYKQDTKSLASDEMSNYKQWLAKVQEAAKEQSGDNNGEISVPQYEPKHPGWVVKGGYRAGYIRQTKAVKSASTANDQES